ncbi:hypothetical protein [Priestia aryabhattai]
MKHLSKTIIAFVTLLTILIGFSGPQKTEAAYTYGPPSYSSYEEGDVLITSSSVAGGLTGHAGIVAKGPDGVLYAIHTPGYGKGIEKISLANWWVRYPKTELHRYKNESVAKKAGQRAFKTYLSSKNTIAYDIAKDAALDRKNTKVLYCSKFVWQNYYYGANVNLGYNPNTKYLITPYSLRSKDLAPFGNSNFTHEYGYINQ